MPIRQNPVVLSPSRAELAARCHRRHVLHEVVDRRSFNSPSVAFGTVVHKGCSEYWMSNKNRSKAMDSLVAEYNTRADSMNDKHSLILAEDILECYMDNAKLIPDDIQDGDWHLLLDEHGGFVERRVELEFEGKILSFQLDRALTNGEDICIADVKTTAHLNKDKEAEWAISLQQKLYVVGVRKKFSWANNVYSYIEALHKKTTPVFKLVELPRWTQGELDEALELWKHYAEEDELVIGKGMELALQRFDTDNPTPEQLRECVEEIAVTQTTFNYMDCHSYYITCPYLENRAGHNTICSNSPELRLGILWSDFEIHETEGY